VVVDTSSSLHVQITPDGSRVLYVADQDTDDVLELYSAPIGGGASPIKLNGALVSGGDVAANALFIAYRIAPDSTRVVYVADQEADGLEELFLVPLDGSLVPRKLNWPLVGTGVLSLEITSDSRRVVYQATERPQVTELFASVLSFDPGHDHVARHP
jgi:Tol biopolymer transport system component